MPLAFIGGLGPWELLIIAFIVLLLFGATRLPGVFRSLGSGVHEFKKGMSEGDQAAQPPKKEESEKKE